MITTPYTAGLHRLTPSTYAYLHPDGSWGRSNCGLITSLGEGVLVDTQFTIPLTRKLICNLSTVLPEMTVGIVINTHANGDHCWGNELFPDAVIIGSEATARGMADEISPHEFMALMSATPPETPLGDYLRRYFSDFDFSGITVRPPTRTFTDELELRIGAGMVIKLMMVGPAHTDGDVIVHVPDEGVLFAGDVLFIGDHPVMWSGPISNWITACTRILKSGAQTILPGHGAVTDTAGVAHFRGYLEYLSEQAAARYDAGMPYWQAALDIPMTSYADWGHRERLVITVASIYRELGLNEPFDMRTVMDRTAQAFLLLDIDPRINLPRRRSAGNQNHHPDIRRP